MSLPLSEFYFFAQKSAQHVPHITDQRVEIDGLMRHADIRTTMNLYGDVVTDEMREAHSKVVRMARPRA
jgi:integrase